jgi:hypothetical protein
MRRWRAHEKGCGGLALAAWAELARLSRPRPAPYGPHGRGRASARRRRAARETSPPAPRRRPCKMHLLLLFYVPVLQSIHAWSHARVQGRVARALAAGARVRPALLEQQPCHLPPLHACMRDAAGHATPRPFHVRVGGGGQPRTQTQGECQSTFAELSALGRFRAPHARTRHAEGSPPRSPPCPCHSPPPHYRCPPLPATLPAPRPPPLSPSWMTAAAAPPPRHRR